MILIPSLVTSFGSGSAGLSSLGFADAIVGGVWFVDDSVERRPAFASGSGSFFGSTAVERTEGVVSLSAGSDSLVTGSASLAPVGSFVSVDNSFSFEMAIVFAGDGDDFPTDSIFVA